MIGLTREPLIRRMQWWEIIGDRDTCLTRWSATHDRTWSIQNVPASKCPQNNDDHNYIIVEKTSKNISLWCIGSIIHIFVIKCCIAWAYFRINSEIICNTVCSITLLHLSKGKPPSSTYLHSIYAKAEHKWVFTTYIYPHTRYKTYTGHRTWTGWKILELLESYLLSLTARPDLPTMSQQERKRMFLLQEEYT